MSGQVRPGQVRSGQVRSGQVRSGRVGTTKNKNNKNNKLQEQQEQQEHYNQTVRCTTASTNTCCHAGLNGFRKSRLLSKGCNAHTFTKISWAHTDQLDQNPIYRYMGHGLDISWARPHPEHFHFLMLCTRHYNQTVRCTTASNDTCCRVGRVGSVRSGRVGRVDQMLLRATNDPIQD